MIAALPGALEKILQRIRDCSDPNDNLKRRVRNFARQISHEPMQPHVVIAGFIMLSNIHAYVIHNHPTGPRSHCTDAAVLHANTPVAIMLAFKRSAYEPD